MPLSVTSLHTIESTSLNNYDILFKAWNRTLLYWIAPKTKSLVLELLYWLKHILRRPSRWMYLCQTNIESSLYISYFCHSPNIPWLPRRVWRIDPTGKVYCSTNPFSEIHDLLDEDPNSLLRLEYVPWELPYRLIECLLSPEDSHLRPELFFIDEFKQD